MNVFFCGMASAVLTSAVLTNNYSRPIKIDLRVRPVLVLPLISRSFSLSFISFYSYLKFYIMLYLFLG
jgi:hypothetical protein